MDFNESMDFGELNDTIETEEQMDSCESMESIEFVDYNFDNEDELIDNLNDHDPSKPTNVNIIVPMAPNEIILYMNLFMEQVVDMLGISKTTVRLLLNHYKWNKQHLIEAFLDDQNNFEDRDEDTFYKDAGIELSFGAHIRNSAEEEAICDICTDESRLIGLDICNHAFCKTCWIDYLCTKIDESVGIDVIHCPGHNCLVNIDDDIVLELIPSEKTNVIEKYCKLISESFIECHKEMNWCPGVNCSIVYKVDPDKSKPLLCQNNHQFCCSCNQIWHDPITCKLLERWLNYTKDELESAVWIQTNTRPCPNCKVNIEKNHGCNHMTCRKCKHGFCWTCHEPVTHRNYLDHRCNRFVANETFKEEQRYVSIDRLKHFNVRYKNHIKSLMLEQKLFDNADEKMKEMQDTLSTENAITANQMLFYKRAVEILSRSREVLIATYVFAYYSKLCNELAIFEANQEDLERATEQLSHYLEQEITEDNYTDLKIKLQDKADYCNKRKQVLLEHVHEGLDKDWWKLEEQIQ